MLKASFTRKTMLALSRERERERERRLCHIYKDIISSENLLSAWREFLNGKRKKKDVAMFSWHLAHNILTLHKELSERTYAHGQYEHFRISDPKSRDIHKSSVRDRLLHHALYRKLYPFFDDKFIYDSYSCRHGKGTHRALERFKEFSQTVSQNNTRTCWVLKCDIRKFFASIDHRILKTVLAKHVADKQIQWLLAEIIDSFHTVGTTGKGLPLGNLTSQLLVNVYMNQFDQYVKHQLKVKHYIRYADDFVILSSDKQYLEQMLNLMNVFLLDQLKLSLHPQKVFIKTVSSGVDFLGWVHFPTHRVLRRATRKRMFKNINRKHTNATLVSYQGMLRHGNAHNIRKLLPSQ